ncbi:proline--tRNA ligase-like [Pyrus ussuriensis x Pyrus communis]|uniref:proline--tRNA ligase n=1 Tax=Pyrus ussuriensis x Pyrus communis TaxID=2448454 RepID=A0A5N5I2B8_9ROSA|nr:proline--tRNA ligase-like [Pyrus ussuriensis x Pyrus communis]
MVIRPYGYAIWEAIQDYLNVKFKETGHSNMYFPQFIPYSFIEKEASHVEGFSPELAVVTIGGGKELEEKLVVRPTSETIVNHMFTQWIHSYRDLPLMAIQMIDVHTKFAYEETAIPVIAGRKSKIETFAGVALQAGTSHNLGQNFSRAFGTQFIGESGQRQHVWQTSGAVSTRFVVITPIWKKDDDREGVLNAASSVKEALQTADIRVKLDSDQRTPGWKFNFWEMKGVPLRIEIGPHVPGKQGKVFGISMEPSVLKAYVKDKLDEIQSSLVEKAKSFRDSNIVDVSSYDELKVAISQGIWARGPWSASDKDELKVKEETGATIRCFPFEQPEGIKTCLMTGNCAEEVAIFAKSY